MAVAAARSKKKSCVAAYPSAAVQTGGGSAGPCTLCRLISTVVESRVPHQPVCCPRTMATSYSSPAVVDFLRLRHLLRGVADEQRHRADQDDHPCQPQRPYVLVALGVAAFRRRGVRC